MGENALAARLKALKPFAMGEALRAFYSPQIYREMILMGTKAVK